MRDVAALRALTEPIADLLAPMPYTQMFPPDDPDYHPTAVTTNLFLDRFGEERVRAAYPGATWDRLRAVKARYDPDNLFRHNQNVPAGV